MFEKEAEEYLATESKYLIEDNEGNIINIAKKVKQSFIDGAEFGYNKGYHDAEEHYMNMELFDKKFVHFMWDDKLEEKEGFFADDICELTNCVLGGNLHFAKVRKSLSPAFPFKDTNNNDWLFFYYDPNYGIKKAYMEGTQVQYRFKDAERWHDTSESDIADIKRTGLRWFDDNCEYRIKPKESNLMTYRQPAEWLAKGNSHGVLI